MRSIGILCSGPSLSSFLAAPRRHDAYIGVNRAATAFDCDYWCFNDAETFVRHVPRGTPVCCASNEAYRRLVEVLPRELGIDEHEVRRRADRHAWLFFAAANTSCPSDPGWSSFSLTSAMVVAEYLFRHAGTHDAAPCVSLYGVDQAGELDWDGPSPTPVTRTGYRWDNEQHKFGHVSRWLRGCGVRLEHVRPVAEAIA